MGYYTLVDNYIQLIFILSGNKEIGPNKGDVRINVTQGLGSSNPIKEM